MSPEDVQVGEQAMGQEKAVFALLVSGEHVPQ